MPAVVCLCLSLHFVQRSVTLARLLKISRKENLTCMTFQVLPNALQMPSVLLLNMCAWLEESLCRSVTEGSVIGVSCNDERGINLSIMRLHTVLTATSNSYLTHSTSAANEVENDVYAALYGDDDTAGLQGPQEHEANHQVASEGEAGHSGAGTSIRHSPLPFKHSQESATALGH